MGLFNVSLSQEDRPRIDRLTSVLDRTVSLVENIVHGKELVLRISFENKGNRDDIQK